MTAIFYEDCSAVSGNSRWKATAVSPHNGSILRRDGTSAEDEFSYRYRQHQSEFRYRLLSEDGSTVWERWQPPREDSPHELIVGDDGTVVIRTHGFRPELIVIRPDGQVTIRVAIESADDPEEREAFEGEVVCVDTLQRSTAGNFWTGHSWPYFVSTPRGQLFVWRTYGGQRIVIDPVHGLVIPTDDLVRDGVANLLDTTEGQESLNLLMRVCEKKKALTDLLMNPDKELDHATLDDLRSASAAILLSGVHRLREAIPFLKNLEDMDCASYSTSTTSMRGYSIESQFYRPLIQHSLKLMDEVPVGYPSYYFTNFEGRHPVKIIERRAEELGKLRRRMKPKDILEAVGTPDYVLRYSVKRGNFNVWPEKWEYDEFDGQEWLTTVLHWEVKKRGSGFLDSIKTEEASWKRSPERLRDILRR